MANYPVACSPYEFSGTIEYVIAKLENDSRLLITILNPSQIMVSTSQ